MYIVYIIYIGLDPVLTRPTIKYTGEFLCYLYVFFWISTSTQLSGSLFTSFPTISLAINCVGFCLAFRIFSYIFLVFFLCFFLCFFLYSTPATLLSDIFYGSALTIRLCLPKTILDIFAVKYFSLSCSFLCLCPRLCSVCAHTLL